jgi:hypothetical protein
MERPIEFVVKRTTELGWDPDVVDPANEIRFTTLAEFIEWVKGCGHEVIVGRDGKTLEIYDGYRE